MILIVNRSRARMQRVDRVDYIWVCNREWQGRKYLDLSFHTNETATSLKRYETYGDRFKVVEAKSMRKVMSILKAFAPNIDSKNLKKRIRYNRTAIQSMMRRLDLQERVHEALVS
jgi:hypothetical protein